MGGMERRTAGVVAIGVAAVLALAFVASGDVVHVWSDPPPRSAEPVVRPAADTEPVLTVPEEVPAGGQPRDDGWMLAVLAVVLACIIAAAVWIVGSSLLEWRLGGRARRRIRRGTGLRPLPTVPDPVVVLDEEAQLAALEQGTPRNAIVACWLQMEADVERAGLARSPSETSTEYTTRVLASTSLDPAPVHELAALYREARFSRHELHDGHRRRAVDAVRRIHAQVQAATAAAAADGAGAAPVDVPS